VTTDDRAYCWGDNSQGQLGNGTSDSHDHPRPVAVAGGRRFVRVDAGGVHTCGVTTDDLVFCWGRNHVGQLGDGTTTPHPTPVAVAGGRHFRQVSAGGVHTCGLTPFNVAFCWGFNENGRLGDGTTTTQLLPVKVLGGLQFSQLSASHAFADAATCAVTTDDRAYCWGGNQHGQLGDGTINDRLTPGAVAAQLRFIAVSAGFSHTCGVNSFNRVFCWGDNRFGQLGDNSRTNSLVSVRVHAPGLPFRRVSAGSLPTCALTLEDRAFCWGAGGYVGDGTEADRLKPVAVGGSRRFRQVSAGDTHSCAVTTSNRAFCWGENRSGMLGDGTTSFRVMPVAVAGTT
jgi:alpha-tubulin suppressor-like RCC1 family protein